MATRRTQGGDPLLVPRGDGLDLELSGGLVTMSEGLENAVTLSLFGGNREDSCRPGDPEEWWGNSLAKNEAEKLRSEFQRELTSSPLSSSSPYALETAARSDLQWMVSGRLVDSVEVSVSVTSSTRVKATVAVSLGQSKNTLELWGDTAGRVLGSTDVLQRLAAASTCETLGTVGAIYDADYGVTTRNGYVTSWAPKYIRALLPGETEAAVRAALTLVQPTAGLQPILVTRSDGYPAVVWDGVDDVMTCAGLAQMLPLSNYSIGLNGNLKGNNTGRCLWVGKIPGSVRPYSLGCNGDTTLQHWCNSSATDQSTANVVVPAGARSDAYVVSRSGNALDVSAYGMSATLPLTRSSLEEAATQFTLGARLATEGYDLPCALRLSSLWVYLSPVNTVATARAMRDKFPPLLG